MKHADAASLGRYLEQCLGGEDLTPPGTSQVPLLPHLLGCEACARAAREAGRRANPSARLDLFPETDCPEDLESLEASAHARSCLWCALALHDADLPAAPLGLAFRCRSAVGAPRRTQDRVRSPGNIARVGVLERPSLPVLRVIPTLVARLGLPVTAPDGTPMNYTLVWKEGARRLDEGLTLAESGVREGDHLVVYPEMVEPFPRILSQAFLPFEDVEPAEL